MSKLCRWSMGGLAALQVAERIRPRVLILIEPSPPGEIQGFDQDVELSTGTFDPEAVYGPFPPGQLARLESSLARSQRKRGIAVPSIPCPALAVYGSEFTQERDRAIAQFYGGKEIVFPELDHWGPVLDPRVPRALDGSLASGPREA